MIPVHDATPIKLAFKEKNADVQEEFTTDVVTQCLTIDCKKCTGSYVNTAFRHADGLSVNVNVIPHRSIPHEQKHR